MRAYAGEGFDRRKPGRKRIMRRALVSLGPNAEWSLDGFDKMLEAGFAIYGIRDKWSRFWLHYVVVPSNRYAAAVGVIFLHCVQKYGGTVSKLISQDKILRIYLTGIPVQVTSDRGSETRDAYAFQCALR